MKNTIVVNQYKLDSISSKMTKKYGAMKKGDEERYSMLLFCMEGNLLKLHRDVPERNSRRAIEAISMCLLKVDGYLNELEYDVSQFSNEYNQTLCEGLLSSFDPYSNKLIQEASKNYIKLETESDRVSYFDVPVKCLLRVQKSVEHWIDALGNDGYFDFLERQMGKMVRNNNKMEFAVLSGCPDD